MDQPDPPDVGVLPDDASAAFGGPGDLFDVQVQRVGTQVVVRLYGTLDRRAAGRLCQALGEVEAMVLSRVVIDLDEVDAIEDAGLDFIVGLHRRWRVRLLNTPNQLRGRIPRLVAHRPHSPPAAP